jgi:mono/diheme cytochrome c family protein
VPSPERGRALLLNRSFLGQGVPISTVDALLKPDLGPTDGPSAPSGRAGFNRFAPMGYAGKNFGEVRAISETCLLCHAGALRGEWVLGLGNSFVDAAVPPQAPLINPEKLEQLKPSAEERALLSAWNRHQQGVAPYARARNVGTTAALYFTGYFFAHRRTEDFAWVESPAYPMLDTPPPETDTPAWWLLKKKRALYYGGELTGDFTRSLMQFMSPEGNSFEAVRAAEGDFEDILAYLRTLEPPPFPGKVDAALAQQGRALFDDTCARCHGAPGGPYPSLVIPLERIGTDAARHDFMGKLGFAAHYNDSWYGERSRMAATAGYLAPPLDGVWATAPYLHNGSVPTLAALLDPSQRPTYFVRSRDSRAYELDSQVGWQVEVLDHGQAEERDAQRRRYLFDTTLYGKGSGGHTFGQALTAPERRAVLEFLKTL